MRIACQRMLAIFRLQCAPTRPKCAVSLTRHLHRAACRRRQNKLSSVLSFLLLTLLFNLSTVGQVAGQTPEGSSSRAAKSEAIRTLPLNRMNTKVRKQVHSVVDHPSFYRRMPAQSIECDPQMFDFLVKRPEVMVNIWQIMGITKVTAKRVNPYSFFANDGAGTVCRCDLIYSDRNLHVYYGDGSYDGSMAPRKVTGSCVCILRSNAARNNDGADTVSGTMDVFLKLDNFGADLLARSVAPFVGKTADFNFVETAKFISQISQVCQRSPAGAVALASKLDSLQPTVRSEFARLAANVGAKNGNAVSPSRRSLAGNTPGLGSSQNMPSRQSTYQDYAESVRRAARDKRWDAASGGNASSLMKSEAGRRGEVMHLSDSDDDLKLSKLVDQSSERATPSVSQTLTFNGNSKRALGGDMDGDTSNTRSGVPFSSLVPERRVTEAKPSGTGRNYVGTQSWQSAPAVVPRKQNIYMRR